MNATVDKIKKQIADNPVIMYMKGTPEAPECGYSKAACEALASVGIQFTYVNVLAAPFIRERLPSVSNWPTFPQLFVAGELVGGSDIVVDMVEQGTLKPMVDKVSEGVS